MTARSIAYGGVLDFRQLDVRGLLRPPFPLPEMFDHAASHTSASPWVLTQDNNQTLTYGGAARQSRTLAHGLIELGFRPGDRLAILTPNHPAFLVAMIATWRTGGIVAGLHPAYADDLLVTQLKTVTPSALLTLDRSGELARARRIAKLAGCQRLLAASIDGPTRVRAESADGRILVENLLAGPDHAPQGAALLGSPAVLQFTGGSTGTPKAAVLTHEALSTNLAQFASLFPDMLYGEETFLGLPPLAHILGLNLIANFSAYLGSEIVLEQRFDADEIATLCARRGISFFGGVPTMFAALNESRIAQNVDWSRLRYAAAGGAPVLGSIKRRFEQMTGCTLLQGYGLSETSPAAAFTRPDEEAPEGSAGRPVPETYIEIRSPDNWRQTISSGETGEIFIRGPQLMQGYWGNPDETRGALKDGFLSTGDLGKLDDRGQLFILDRLKDIIITNGFNVYPARIEDAVARHPDIVEVAAVGELDERRGEIVSVVVVLRNRSKLALGELQAFVAEHLSPLEMPRRMHVVDALPKSPAGKILRRAAGNLIIPTRITPGDHS